MSQIWFYYKIFITTMSKSAPKKTKVANESRAASRAANESREVVQTAKSKKVTSQKPERYMYIGTFIDADEDPDVFVFEFADKDLGKRFHNLVKELCHSDMGSSMAIYIDHILQGGLIEENDDDILGETEYLELAEEMSKSLNEKWTYKMMSGWVIDGSIIPVGGVKSIGIFNQEVERS